MAGLSNGHQVPNGQIKTAKAETPLNVTTMVRLIVIETSVR